MYCIQKHILIRSLLSGRMVLTERRNKLQWSTEEKLRMRSTIALEISNKCMNTEFMRITAFQLFVLANKIAIQVSCSNGTPFYWNRGIVSDHLYISLCLFNKNFVFKTYAGLANSYPVFPFAFALK